MVDRIFPGSGVNSFLRGNSIIKGSDDSQESAKTLEEITTLDIPRLDITPRTTESYCPYQKGGMLSSIKNGISTGMNRMRRFHPMGHVHYNGFSVGRLVIFILFLFIVVYIFTSPYVSRMMNNFKNTVTSNARSLTSDITGRYQGGYGSSYANASKSYVSRAKDDLRSNPAYQRLLDKYNINGSTSSRHSSHGSRDKMKGASIVSPVTKTETITSKLHKSLVNYSNKDVF